MMSISAVGPPAYPRAGVYAASVMTEAEKQTAPSAAAGIGIAAAVTGGAGLIGLSTLLAMQRAPKNRIFPALPAASGAEIVATSDVHSDPSVTQKVTNIRPPTPSTAGTTIRPATPSAARIKIRPAAPGAAGTKIRLDYQEAQEGNYCGKHASNAVLRGLAPASANAFKAKLQEIRRAASPSGAGAGNTSELSTLEELVTFHNGRVEELRAAYPHCRPYLQSVCARSYKLPHDARDVAAHASETAVNELFADLHAPRNPNDLPAVDCGERADRLAHEIRGFMVTHTARPTAATESRSPVTHWVAITWTPRETSELGTWRLIDSSRANFPEAVERQPVLLENARANRTDAARALRQFFQSKDVAPHTQVIDLICPRA